MSTLVELLSLADKKIEYLQEMIFAYNEQAKCIEEDRFEDIEQVLDNKDNLIKKIDEIDALFNEKKSDELLKDDSLKSKLVQIKDILMDIKSIDDRYEEDMKKSIEDSKKDLKETRKNQVAMQQYSKSNPYQAFASLGGTLFIDEDS